MNWVDSIRLGSPLSGVGSFAVFGILIGLVVLWSLIWKGLALWRAARKSDTVWFVVLLALNTAGILEILYLYVFSKKSDPVVEQRQQI